MTVRPDHEPAPQPAPEPAPEAEPEAGAAQPAGTTEPAAEAPRLVPQLLTGDEEALKAADRPVLIVGPSLGTSVTALWGPALPFLEPDFHVLGWDLPGHGQQPTASSPFTLDQLADAVETMTAELAETYGWSGELPVFAAGVSIAGVVSLTLSLREETRFARLAVICSAATIGTEQSWRERAELVSTAGTPTMMAGSSERWFAPGFLSAQPKISAHLLHSLQDADRHGYAAACRALSGVDLRPELEQVQRPVVAIAGAQDQVCPPADAEFIAAHAPGAHAVTLDDVAHLAPAEAPDRTARILKEFFHA